MNGVIVVNKMSSWTSRDVVNKISLILGTKKVGHTGTLDPIASGVLVITVGKYTKLNDYLTSTYKEYIATFKLGIKTDTLDISGYILEENKEKVDEEEIKRIVKSFEKKYMQEVPIYSAVKVNGKKLYEYARNNEEVKLPIKEVDIKKIDILEIKDDIVKIKCLVSKGTYIRSLIRDIGLSLNVGATMIDLIRTKQGNFSLEESYTIDDIKDNNYTLLKIEDIIDVEKIELNDNDILYKKVINGNKIDYIYEKDFVLFVLNNEEIALYKKDIDFYRLVLKIGD